MIRELTRVLACTTALALGGCGGGVSPSCPSGTPCVPANPCDTGTISCAAGAQVCADTGTPVADGSACGAGMTCTAGACTSCSAGTACLPSNPCDQGATSCSGGSSSCVDTGTPVADGTMCGAGDICQAGACTVCSSIACPPANPCHHGTLDCSTGALTCVDTGVPVADGTACGTGMVCVGGSCTSCVPGASCAPGNPCDTGTQQCSGTPTCMDTGTHVSDGTPCGTGLECHVGACFVTGAMVSTVAGSGRCALVNGPVSMAEFCAPIGLAFDRAGDLFVADSGDHVIREIDTTGNVSTFAGSGAAGLLDGQGTAAELDTPAGLAIDAAGDLYVADRGNNTIRKIDPTGYVSTVAGTGSAGFLDGPGGSAMFYYPSGVTVDAAGDVYVGDVQNERVRKIDPTGIVSTLAGNGTSGDVDGPGACAELAFPQGVVLDAAGNLDVAAWGDGLLRQVTPAGVTSWLAGATSGPFSDGPARIARMDPSYLQRDTRGNLVVTEQLGYRVRRMDPGGFVTTLAGTGNPGYADGPGYMAQFWGASGVALDGAGNIYVSDSDALGGMYSDRIRKIVP